MRLFIAVNLSEKQRLEVDRLQQRLKKNLAGVKWITAHDLHLTLKFLGETDPPRLPSILTALNNLAAELHRFILQLNGVGVFPNPQQARIVWCGVSAGREELRQSAAKLEQALAGVGFKAERRSYLPHLTLGRLRYPVDAATVNSLLTREAGFISTPAVVDKIIIYQSRLTQAGAIYKMLHEIYLT